jgi:hypothetical protein
LFGGLIFGDGGRAQLLKGLDQKVGHLFFPPGWAVNLAELDKGRGQPLNMDGDVHLFSFLSFWFCRQAGIRPL